MNTLPTGAHTAQSKTGQTATTAPMSFGDQAAAHLLSAMPKIADRITAAELGKVFDNALAQVRAAAPCALYTWCTGLGEHTTHTSAFVETAGRDGLGDVILPANILACEEVPSIAFLDLDLTPAQTRQRCAQIRVHLEQVEALADQLDEIAPLDPSTETYSLSAPGAAGKLISAEIYESDDPSNPHSKLAVWAEPMADGDLDVTGADKLIGDLEQFIPRLRALRNHLADIEASR